jgi:2-polyprenyl-3-methyl-5-hydroxy-6-metoxy-1,4-benzoquinol methylase
MDLTERPEPGTQARRHPWETARFEFFSRLVRRVLAGRTAPVTVLDAGAGDGWFAGELLRLLPAGSRITCWDVFYSADDLAPLSAASPTGLWFTAERPAERFDWLIMLDVLEHIDDDFGALSTLVEHNLSAGAHALLSVPAHQRLFSRHDVALQHFRRYSRRQLLALAAATGLERLEDGGLFHSLLAPRVWQKLVERVRPPVDGPPPRLGDWQGGRLVTGLTTALLRLDNRFSELAQRGRLAVPGLSQWVLCQKP